MDGIRGLAVLLVLYCHATVIQPTGVIGQLFLASARISWCGVDLFFVLSGFLITGILFDAKGKDHYFRNFYARRTLRIFPLYYAFLIFALLIAPRVGFLAGRFGELPAQPIWYWLYLSNFYQSIHDNTNIVHVSWSLAIEEQFYLCWPLVVFLCNRRLLLRLCVVFFFGSLLLRSGILVAGADWTTVRTWAVAGSFTLCRLDGLAAGAWIALTLRDGRQIASLARPARLVAAVTALAMGVLVVGSFALGWRGGIGQSPAYISVGYSILALMFGAILILAVNAQPGSALNRIFAGRFLTTWGRYSYAVYLLHMPVNLLVQQLLFDPNQPHRSNAGLIASQAAYYVVTFALSLLIAWLSWNLLEKHFLKLKDAFATAHSPAPTGPLAQPIKASAAA